jgi:hypothetical protein
VAQSVGPEFKPQYYRKKKSFKPNINEKRTKQSKTLGFSFGGSSLQGLKKKKHVHSSIKEIKKFFWQYWGLNSGLYVC